jgi:glycosyltransferase involved in cell wall biosynthesis
MHIAFFTPLAPLQTALADHSEGLLPYLAQGADIDLFIDEGYQPASQNIVERFNIYSYKEFPGRAAEYDLNVYVMGNNPTFHGYMHALMHNHPGVVVLHDTQFQHYYIERTLGHGDIRAYQAEMEYAYGEAGRRAAALALAGQIDRIRGIYPLVERIVDRSLGVIVYNDFAYRDLLMRCPQADVQRLNYHFYLPQGFSAELDVQALKKRWGVDGSFLVGTFGLFTSPDRRIDICLQAFKRFLNTRPDARYLLVGTHSPEYDVLDMIQSYELEDSVTLTGWMDALEFAQHLCVPDIAIHLRYPHLGGTLYTPIRLLGLGQPAILSDIEPLAEFPEGCCAKVIPDEYEEDTLLEMLEYLAEHEDLRRQMGENGRQFIHENYNVTQIAQQHLDFFEQVASSPANPIEEQFAESWTSYLVQESAAILAGWDVNDDEEVLLTPIAEAIASLAGGK